LRKHIFILTFLVSITLNAVGQSNSQSPFSIYGIGDAQLSPASTYMGTGHAQIAMLSTVSINPLNPATFSQIARPVFNFDLRAETLVLDNATSNQSNTLVSISNLTFAFPLLVRAKRKRNAGISFGLLPRTQSGYETLTQETIPDLGAVDYLFTGDGGLNEMYLGLGYDIIRDSGAVNTLSLGVRGQYVFGNIERNRYTIFSPTVRASNVSRENQIEVSDGDFQLGVTYLRKLYVNREDETGFFSAGAYFQPSSNLSASERDYVYTYTGDVTNPNQDIGVIDTVLNEDSGSEVVYPSSFGLGLGLSLNNRWNFGLDLASTSWSELSIGGVNADLNNSSRISFGTEFVPDITAYKRFFEVMRYRAGFSLQQTRLDVNGGQPLRYGINLGLGIPLFASRSTSMFNVAFEYARRDGGNIQVSETYFNFQFGVSITPNVYDKWFNKRKYD